ncbi:peptidase M50 [Dehalogenimonas sp. WBC-2]|nr:peptidase M50 [Dehalogenimonas sp. WBC-2]
MDNGFNFGRIFGIQFRIHYSWVFIYFLITVFLALQVFPGAVPKETDVTFWVMGAVTALLFFLSVLFHEAAHALVGQNNGIPVKSITLFLFGGAAQMTREPQTAAAELKMALAGPMTSLVLAAVFYGTYYYFLGTVNVLAAIALWLSQINLIVAVFNMLPGFPLDGGRIFRGLWWHFRHDYEKATRVAIFIGRIFGFIIVGAGAYFIIYYSDWLAGIWLAVIGLYLEYSARTSLKQFEMQLWLKGWNISDVTNWDCPIVRGGLTTKELKQQYPNCRSFWVEEDGQTAGVLLLSEAGDLAGVKAIKELSQPIEAALEITSETGLLTVVQEFNETDKDFAVVIGHNGQRGLLFLDSLVDLVNQKMKSAAQNQA